VAAATAVSAVRACGVIRSEAAATLARVAAVASVSAVRGCGNDSV